VTYVEYEGGRAGGANRGTKGPAVVEFKEERDAGGKEETAEVR